MIHEDLYNLSLHSLAASKQHDGCELREGRVREIKTCLMFHPGLCMQSYFVLKQEQILGIVLLLTLLRTCYTSWGHALR